MGPGAIGSTTLVPVFGPNLSLSFSNFEQKLYSDDIRDSIGDWHATATEFAHWGEKLKQKSMQSRVAACFGEPSEAVYV